jgi:hypothetical protein
MSYTVGLIGMWIVTDGIYSLALYLNAPSYQGSPKQTFWRDHWIRGVRIILGITLIVMGGIYG